MDWFLLAAIAVTWPYWGAVLRIVLGEIRAVAESDGQEDLDAVERAAAEGAGRGPSPRPRRDEYARTRPRRRWVNTAWDSARAPGAVRRGTRRGESPGPPRSSFGRRGW